MSIRVSRSGSIAAMFFVMAVLLMLAFGTARSEAYIYWTNGVSDQISRADNDGTKVDPDFLWWSVDNPSGMVIDSTEIYWVNNSDLSVRRANIDGSGETLGGWIPSGITSAWGIGIDPNYAYYSNIAGSSIGRKNRATGALDQVHVSPTGLQPGSVAVNSTHIFWTTGENKIGRANLDGSGVNTNFITGINVPRTVVVNGDHIFWTSYGSGTIGRANLNGTDPNLSFITGASSPAGLALHGSHIYWTNTNPNTVGRANLDGIGVNQNFMALAAFAAAIAVDSGVSPPELTIDSGPEGPTLQKQPAFGFNAEAGTTVACSIDTGTPSFGPCSGSSTHSPATALADGSWTFRVRATKGAGNEIVKTRAFSVDTTPPTTVIDGAPYPELNSPEATFVFSSNDANATFECQMDAEAWATCLSPMNYTELSDGSHVFKVRAKDPLGNTEPTPATSQFTVDTTPPDTVISSGPQGTITTAATSFSFNSPESGVTFRCQMDGSSWQNCTSPAAYTDLADGEHEFKVAAVDGLDNVDASPATRSFRVDTSGPTGPTGPTQPTGPTGPTGPAGPVLPSNVFSFGKVKPNKKNGTATLQVKVPGPGKVQLLGSKTVAKSSMNVKGKSTVVLKVKAKGKAAKQLKKKTKATVKVKVRFTPTGGTPATKTKTVKLKR